MKKHGQVLIAEPYRYAALGSNGDASYMLMRQFQFPNTYDPDLDKITQADSDRLCSWDYQHTDGCHRRHFEGKGGGGMEGIVERLSDDELMAFVKDVLKADPNVQWTGFRILGTVNRATGYAVYTYELFAKHPESKTTVFSDGWAPNVRPGGWNGHGYRGRHDRYYGGRLWGHFDWNGGGMVFLPDDE